MSKAREWARSKGRCARASGLKAALRTSATRPAEFDALFASAVRTTERIGRHRLRLGLGGPPDLEATVRDLTARESECCSFFTFTVHAEPGWVVLDIEVPAAHIEVLDALTERAERARGSR